MDYSIIEQSTILQATPEIHAAFMIFVFLVLLSRSFKLQQHGVGVWFGNVLSIRTQVHVVCNRDYLLVSVIFVSAERFSAELQLGLAPAEKRDPQADTEPFVFVRTSTIQIIKDP